METTKIIISRQEEITNFWSGVNQENQELVRPSSGKDRLQENGGSEITFNSMVAEEIFGWSGNIVSLTDVGPEEGGGSDSEDDGWRNNEDPDAGTAGSDTNVGTSGGQEGTGKINSGQGTGSTQGDVSTDNDLTTDEKIGGNEASGAGAAGGTDGQGTGS